MQARLSQPRSFQLPAGSFLPALPCQQPLEPSLVQQRSPSQPMHSSNVEPAGADPKHNSPARESTSKSRDETLASGRVREKERYSANLRTLGKHRQSDRIDALNAALLDPSTLQRRRKNCRGLRMSVSGSRSCDFPKKRSRLQANLHLTHTKFLGCLPYLRCRSPL